ncbi:hypothetical protein BCR42DRAFT_493213 [Absidia repens]|uniref:Uncharacterized protein n=1 Tax=Absidia repens TaxID=90262 RepID=A0A1X2IB25_9FUNG|nr:hypothetical protein BCR42DRAFT_493213 [Absidia repens]
MSSPYLGPNILLPLEQFCFLFRIHFHSASTFLSIHFLFSIHFPQSRLETSPPPKKLKLSYNDTVLASCNALFDDEETKQDRLMIAKLGRWTPLCYHTNDATYSLLSSSTTVTDLLKDDSKLQIGSWSQPIHDPLSTSSCSSLTTMISGELTIDYVKWNSVAPFVRQIQFEEINTDQVKILNEDWRLYPQLRYFGSQFLAGAIFIDGKQAIYVNTIEPYSRDSIVDAHYERRLPGLHSSYPVDDGQDGYVNVVLMESCGYERSTKLTIGLRTCDFLVTSSIRLDVQSINMGPSTSHFIPSPNTRIFLDIQSIKRATANWNDETTIKSQEMGALFLLKQIRSKFDSLSTYTMCRSSSNLSSPIELQPATIWTLDEHDSPQKHKTQERIASRVFGMIAIEVIRHGRKATMEKESLKCYMDYGNGDSTNDTKISKTLCKIHDLVAAGGSINIIDNNELNHLLVDLADNLSSSLRALNKTRIEEMDKIVYGY